MSGVATGITIPSIDEQKLMATRRTLSQIRDERQWDARGIKRIGNGLAVTLNGEVVLEPRSQAPGQGETEDMQAMFNKFRDWLKSEGAHQIGAEEMSKAGLVEKNVTDPVIPYPATLTPADLAYEFGTPVDTTEIMALCEDTAVYNALPEIINGSKIESWRELSSLVNCSGTSYIGFQPGYCPDFMCETTDAEKTMTKRHIGKLTTLTESDIQHSIASIAAGYGVRELLGPALPAGSTGSSSMVREAIRSLMDKEIKKQQILVINAWDYLLVKGNQGTNQYEFSGLETLVTAANGACDQPWNSAYSGTFSASRFDEFLSAGCAVPTHIFGHPTALQALKLGYWTLGASSGAGAQQVNWNAPGRNLIPGLTFADSIQTSVGNLILVGDARFSRTDNSNGTFSSTLFPLRLVHNGEPLVYRATQIPLSFKELNPGCSAISFMTWAVTALVVKWYCAQKLYTSNFSGLVNDCCSFVFG